MMAVICCYSLLSGMVDQYVTVTGSRHGNGRVLAFQQSHVVNGLIGTWQWWQKVKEANVVYLVSLF